MSNTKTNDTVERQNGGRCAKENDKQVKTYSVALISILSTARQASFITCEASICWEFTVHFFLAVQLPLFHRRVSKQQPPTFRQASHIPKIFLDI